MNSLPHSGPLPRPESREQAASQLKKERLPIPPGFSGEVVFETHEFTSLCPRTGQPDYCTVRIVYAPTVHLLESKALKYYLWSYRQEAAFTETVCQQIADDVTWAIAPASLLVEVAQNPRGGIALVATVRR